MHNRLNINRRDFLNGVALSLAAGTSLSPLEVLAMQDGKSAYYPPSLTGLRGNHVGSFEIAHEVALSGAKFGHPDKLTDAIYDLVVVGGGISGLAAAHFYQDRVGADKNILVLDNHDDFGGHAKRNEFDVDGRRLIGYGGSQSIDTPSSYSDAASGLLEDVGIETGRFYDYFDRQYFERRELRPSVYFSREHYGRDATVANIMGDFQGAPDPTTIKSSLADYPLADESKDMLLSLVQHEEGYLPGMSAGEKEALLRSISYSDFLRTHAGMNDEVVTLLRDSIKGYWGVGWDALSALEAFRLGQPGTAHLGLDVARNEGINRTEPYIFHFPDGNAAVARALVRKLIPGSLHGKTMEDLVTEKIDYSKLDRATSSTRIRLNATAVDVRHSADQKCVDVTYIRGGKPERVRGRHVVLACYNSMIPHICPEVPETQAEAINYAVKVPLVYINIAVRNWHAFANLGTRSVYVPQPSLMHSFGLDFPVSVGGYRYATGPGQPTILHGTFVPTVPDQGLNGKQQHQQGWRRLYEMSFDNYEDLILEQLEGALSRGGFDAERDIAGITVNRWPHGYAYEYNDLYDPPEYGRNNGPHIRGRAQIGRISMANSDASAYAYVNGAIDAADRAVNEQIAMA